MESSGMVDSSSIVPDCMKIARDLPESPVCSCEALLSVQECLGICQAARHSDQLLDLVTSFAMVSDTLCQQYRDNILSKKGASVVMQSIAQHGLIKLEYSSSGMQSKEDELHQQREPAFTSHQSIRMVDREYGALGKSHGEAETENLQQW
ncbi:uncharacterized protein [Ptychodera flava]|uniref:uncharacterized protein n=1 Tax=Ptychodera flava TaxID=63121 RepID=UPI003969E2B5